MDDTEVRLRIEIELRDKIGRMSAEIERLRAALEEMKGVVRILIAARAALQPKEGEK